MSLDLEEVNETQQLMQNEVEEEEQKNPRSATSPIPSNKMSSGAASVQSSSRNPQIITSTGTNSLNDSTKVSYVNERRLHRDLMRSNYNNKSKHIPKEAPDVKHMEKALLELLHDFDTGKLSAFSQGCSMEQMISIRDQQEHLARLHFRLYADVEKPTEDAFDDSASRDKIAQLVASLEQLSTSIEHLHSEENISTHTEADVDNKPPTGITH